MGSPQFPLNRYFRKPLTHKKSGEEHLHEEKHQEEKFIDSSHKHTGLTGTNQYSKNDLIEMGHSVSSLKQNIHLQTEKISIPPEIKISNPFPEELFAEDKEIISKPSLGIENQSKTFFYNFLKYLYNCLKLLLEQIVELVIFVYKLFLSKIK